MRMKKILLSLFIAFVSSFTVVIFLNFFHRGRAGFLDLLSTLPIHIYFMAFLIFTSSYFLEALRIVYLVRHRGYKIGFFSAIYNTVIGYLFSFLTPFAMGGQPFQVFHLSKLGVDSSYATGIMGARMLENSLGGAVIALIMLNTSLGWILKNGHLVIGGVIISLSVSIAIVISMFKPKILMPLVKIASRIFKKDLVESFNTWRENFELSINYMWKENFYLIILDVLEWFATLVIQIYSLFYILNFLSNVKLNFWLVFGSINAVNALAYFIPTPGASGGIEFTYQYVLSGITMNSGIALKAVTSWRVVSYYLQILLGIIFLGAFGKIGLEGNK